ncbi:recombinase family protein [Brevundimonas sp.]|uniref:recombinase family protein n=1 Tax=Brevundimonas sp. TaxID=1871086 RepID=UPI0028B171C8|nr:recombinase family protein [Brevundimonas sp.]
MGLFDSPLPPPGSRALLLGRYSDSHQNPLSADDQLAVLRADCERLGWEVVGEFTDKAKSGRSVASRTGYLEMMAAAESGQADVICVVHLDRLGRNARELHYARNRLRDVDVVIYTHDKGVMGRFEFAIFAEMAQIESERIGQRTSRGRLAAAARGKIMGDIPYGYRLVDEVDEGGNPLLNSRGAHIRRVERDPATSKIVLRANLEYDAGMSPHQIAVGLTADNVPTPEGGKVWHPNTIMGSSRYRTGFLRNPLIIGKAIHGKVTTDYDEKSGKVKKKQGDASTWIEHDAPWLRIVPQEVWDRNQERLSKRPASKLRDRRRPSYLLSGLVKCGVCGGPYNQVSAKMGCASHRLKACPNGRRAKREDVERVVLEGLTHRLSQPNVIEWFIPEYLRERGSAQTEGLDRHERAVQRLAEVGREIDNLMRQIKTGASGFAANLINDNLNTLGAEKERLARTVRAGPARAVTDLTPGNLVARVGALLDNLGDALNGPERDAARARDNIRSLITQVTVTPYDPEGKRPDGRGAGAVRVQIEGEVSRLVDRAMLNRKIMHDRGAEDMHDLPIATFRFEVILDRSLSIEQEGLWEDVACIGRLLDDADRPVFYQEMIQAMNDRGRPVDAAEADVDETRARIALAQLRRDKWARAIRLGGTHGWVWSDRSISDAEWRERYEQSLLAPEPINGVSASGSIGVIRLSEPDVGVVLIGRNWS